MNSIQKFLEEKEKEFDEKFPPTHNIYPSNKKGYLTISEYSVCQKEINSFLRQSLEELSEKIKQDLLAIADKGELEELRREVEKYFRLETLCPRHRQ